MLYFLRNGMDYMGNKIGIKSILPKFIKDALVDHVGRIQLACISKQSFPNHNLRMRSDIALDAVWRNSAITETWERDNSNIFTLWRSGRDAVNRGDCRAIYYLIAAIKPERVLEVGTNIGASTLYIAAALSSHCSTGARVTTVDILDVNGADGPWAGAGLAKTPSDFMRNFDLVERVDFVCSPALDYMSRAEPFDFIFLDGSHAHGDVYREVSAAIKILSPNGVILLHDYYPEGRPIVASRPALMGPFRALKRIQHENEEITVLPLGELPWPTKQNSRTTSLALVLRSRAI